MEKVSFGKSDWLFLDHDANNVMMQHRGEMPLTSSMLQHWSAIWDRRWRAFSGNVYFLLAPDPQSIFPEFLPFEPVTVRPVHQLLDALRGQQIYSHVVYPYEELLIGKASGKFPVYTKTDTHWTSYGAFVAYRATLHVVQEKHPNIKILTEEDIAFASHDKVGDLGNKLSPMRSSSFVRCTVRAPQAREVFNNGMLVRGSFHIYQNADASLASCVLFGTSYSYPMLSILKESFSTLVFCHRPSTDADIIAKVKPDVVLFEMAERFINRVPTDSPDLTHDAIVLAKLKAMSTEERGTLATKLRQVRAEESPLVRYFVGTHLQLIDAAGQET